jgi:hypothetical protein
MKRVCDGCGEKLKGKRGHGFVDRTGRRLVCGRPKRWTTVRKFSGERVLELVSSPGCEWWR